MTAGARLAGAGDALAGAAVRAVARWATGGAVAVVEGRPPGTASPAPEVGDRRRRPDRPEVTVAVHDPAAYRAVLLGGSVGLGRSYAAGWWDCDDLVALLRLATRALPRPGGRLDALAGVVGRRRSRRRDRHDDPAADRADVQAHYDLGDDFFSLFLDPTLTYSCGIFETEAASMEEASIAKLDRICSVLELGVGDEVLEIGTGWGSFALHAAGRYGCRVTTTTISDRQFDTARRRVGAAGLDHRVTVLGDDYRDLVGTYDHVVSIEMIEAVGWRNEERFLRTCADRLRPGGTMALQAIVIDDRRYERAKHREDLVKALVFPGSSIPSVASITAAATRAGLQVVGREHLGPHYVETLARWRARFGENRGRIAALGYPPELLRLWDLYLAYCEAGFAEGRIDDVQLVLSKTDQRLVDATAPTVHAADHVHAG